MSKIDFSGLNEVTKKEIDDSLKIKDMVDNCEGWKVFNNFLIDKKNNLDKNWTTCKTIEDINALKESIKFIGSIWEWIANKVDYSLRSKEVFKKGFKKGS